MSAGKGGMWKNCMFNLVEMHRSGSKKSNPSKGWAKDAPRGKRERRRLLRECGERCFLVPSDLKFPVCRRIGRSRRKRRSFHGKSSRRQSKRSCRPDCRGILAAKVRARQWKYSKVARKADNLALSQDCSWKNWLWNCWQVCKIDGNTCGVTLFASWTMNVQGALFPRLL